MGWVHFQCDGYVGADEYQCCLCTANDQLIVTVANKWPPLKGVNIHKLVKASHKTGALDKYLSDVCRISGMQSKPAWSYTNSVRLEFDRFLDSIFHEGRK